MTMQFNPPPGWPTPPPGWMPAADWQPDPSWPAAPDGWQFWVPAAPMPGAVAGFAPAGVPAGGPADRAMVADAIRADGRKSMLIGGIVAAIGLVITIGSYAAATGGGTYVVTWGAIVFGGLQFFRGVAVYASANRKAAETIAELGPAPAPPLPADSRPPRAF